MLDVLTSRLILPILGFILCALMLYGALVVLLGLERFDATLQAQDTVRVIR